MKINIIYCLLLLFFQSLSFAQITIHSTVSGGAWTSSSTWVGGIIPGPGDNVVINGPVIINYLAPPDLPNICNDLLINSGASLQPAEYGGGAGTFILQINGNATIDGSIYPIHNNDDRIHIYLYGDLTCNSNWSPYHTFLAGFDDRDFTFNNGTYILNPITKVEPTGKIYAQTDLKFMGDFNLNGATLEMANHNIIGVSPFNVHNGRIKGNFGVKGNFLVWEDQSHPLFMEGIITVIDTLQNDEYGGGSIYYKLNIDGDLINNGTIKDLNNDDRLTINISGNLLNNSIWKNSIINLTGSSNQNISQGSGLSFNSNFNDLDSLSSVTAISDLKIYGNYDLNRAQLKMDNFKLSISGWLNDGYLNDAVLENGILNNLTTNNSLEVQGKVIVDDGNLFRGDILITDTLQCNSIGVGTYQYNLQVDGDIVNNGVIKNDIDDLLILRTRGDITNNNIWNNYKTVFNGSSEQLITLATGKSFSTWFEDVDSTSGIKANTDLVVNGSIYLGRAAIQMNNHNLIFSHGNYLHNGYVKDVKLKNGTLSHLRFLGEIEIYGRVEIGDNVDAVANILIHDTLTTTSFGGGTYTYKFTVYGTIENTGYLGSIYDDLLNVYVQGNVKNYGDWNSYNNYFLFYQNYNENILQCYNTGSSNIQFNGSAISGNGANSFSIISGGGIQNVPPNQSYDLILRYTALGADSVATLFIDCNQIGSLSYITLIGHNHNTTVNVDEKNKNLIPQEFFLHQNYPNPFNPTTIIKYDLVNPDIVRIKIYDLLGREIKTLVNEFRDAGSYEIVFNASGLASGVYVCKIESGIFIQAKKLVLMK